MKKKWLLLLIGVSVLVASGCSKKEAVTAEELLGNPYGAVVESGDFDITMKLTNADGEQTSSGNLQFDKDGVHFKSSDKEYYLIRSNSYVKEYDYVADTGRWTVKDEDSLDTSVLSNLGIITNAALSDWVITGDSTFDKAGHFGTCDKCLSGEAPLAVTITFDRDTKRLLKAEYVLKEEQPGGVKAYSLTVVCKSVNNIKVQLPDDVKNNAIVEGSSSGLSSANVDMLPDELIGCVEVDSSVASQKEFLDIAEELGIEPREYEGYYYFTTEDFDKINIVHLEREGMSEISETAVSLEELLESSGETSSATDETSKSANELDVSDETSPTSETPAPTGSGGTPQGNVPSTGSVDAILSQLEDKYPGLIASDFYEEEGTSLTLSTAAGLAGDKQAIFSYCRAWAINAESAPECNRAVAVAVQNGWVTLDECVANGADSSELQKLISELN